MRRSPNTVGGGSKTNVNGLAFEGRTDLLESFQNHPNFTVISNRVFKNNIHIGEYYEKHKFYKDFLEPKNVDWKSIIAKKYLPDSIFVNYSNNTIYVIEKKYQAGSGSVDEKLQTCDFKKRVYKKLLDNLNVKVEYYYLLNDWFEKPEYKDVFEYIDKVGCKKFINFIPFKELGIDED
ncbi:PD-(D/E)XK nuclease superfamily protein [Candidatus Neomarinimicrobiota bacterium]